MAQATNEALRTIDGIEAPAPGTWVFDTAHSTVGATVRHLMVGKTRVRFLDFTGSVEVGERPQDTSVTADIQAASIDTSEQRRDEHLRSGDFLDVENFPAITFRSTSVQRTKGNDLALAGDLTIRGVTKPVVLDVTYEGASIDPWGNPRSFFSASTEIDREDFGMTWNQALETGGFLVGKKLKVEIEIEATRA